VSPPFITGFPDGFIFHFILPCKIQVIISIFIGLSQIIDGGLLVSSSDIGIFSSVFSLFEMLWVPVSVVAIFKVKHSTYVFVPLDFNPGRKLLFSSE